MSSSVIFAARPQSNNETSDFIQDMEHAESVAVEKKTFFTGFSLMECVLRAKMCAKACVTFCLATLIMLDRLTQTTI